MVLTSFGASYGAIHDLALQPDGKIVAVGGQCGGESCDVALARYLTDGQLDPSFSEDGRVQTPLGGSSAAAVAIQADGKIVVAGRRCAPTCSEFALLRYDTEGNLDPTFDGDGKVFTDLGGTYEWAEALALQSDGRIVAAGRRILRSRLSVTTFNGSLDTGFSGDGIVTDPAGQRRETPLPFAATARSSPPAVGGATSPSSASPLTEASTPHSALTARSSPISTRHTTTPQRSRFKATARSSPRAQAASSGATEFSGDFGLARYLADGAPPPPAPPVAPPPPLPVRPPSARRCDASSQTSSGRRSRRARRLPAARRCALGKVSRAYSATVERAA